MGDIEMVVVQLIDSVSLRVSGCLNLIGFGLRSCVIIIMKIEFGIQVVVVSGMMVMVSSRIGSIGKVFEVSSVGNVVWLISCDSIVLMMLVDRKIVFLLCNFVSLVRVVGVLDSCF